MAHNTLWRRISAKEKRHTINNVFVDKRQSERKRGKKVRAILNLRRGSFRRQYIGFKEY